MTDISEPAAEAQGSDYRPIVWILLYPAIARFRLIAYTFLLVCTTVVVWSLVFGIPFRAESKFLPEGDSGSLSRIGAFAAQLGVGSLGADGDGVEFYAALIRSRQFLVEVGMSPYTVAEEDEEPVSGNLIELYGIERDTPAQEVNALVERLMGDVRVTTSAEAGVVTVVTVSPWPDLAIEINERVLSLVNHFNVERRQYQARAEREFVETRLAEARLELLSAEGDLEEFLRTNRSYTGSPQLSFEAARLERLVEVRQQVTLTLATAFEQARIDEVRNTPAITVMSHPENSAVPDGSVLKRLVFGGTLAGLFGLILAYTAHSLEAARREDPQGFTALLVEFDRQVPPRWKALVSRLSRK